MERDDDTAHEINNIIMNEFDAYKLNYPDDCVLKTGLFTCTNSRRRRKEKAKKKMFTPNVDLNSCILFSARAAGYSNGDSRLKKKINHF